MLFTPSLLFLFPALDPAFPRLDVNQAIALGLIVEFVGYSSAAKAYWRQRRIAFEVAGPVLIITLPTVPADWRGIRSLEIGAARQKGWSIERVHGTITVSSSGLRRHPSQH